MEVTRSQQFLAAVAASCSLAASFLVVFGAHLPRSDVCTDRFRSLIGLSMLMPLYMLILAAYVGPAANLVAFGPEVVNTGAIEPSFRKSLKRDLMVIFRFVLMAMMIWAFIRDVLTIYHIATEESLTSFDKWNMSLVALAISPNISAGFSASAMDGVYDVASIWTRYHEERTLNRVELMLRTHGALFVVYQYIASQYVKVAVFLLMWSSPAIVAYIYVMIPPIVFAFGFGVVTLRKIATFCASRQAGNQQLLSLTDQQQTACMEEIQSQLWGIWENSRFADRPYQREKNFCAIAGIPLVAFETYVTVSCFFGPIVVIGTTLAARLYSGCGYGTSLTQTWEDRHWHDYMGAVLSQTISAEHVMCKGI